jgi:hypothetical protein
MSDIINSGSNYFNDIRSGTIDNIKDMFGNCNNYLEIISQNFNTNYQVNMADNINAYNTLFHNSESILDFTVTPSLSENQRPLVHLYVSVQDIIEDNDFINLYNLS